MNPDKFVKIADSLRQYRRAELTDFENEVGSSPVDSLYVDPLDSNAVLKTVLLNNTTFLVGRKGTGKSTIFAKAQIELRRRNDAVSVYIDVKSLHELLQTSETVIQQVGDTDIADSVLRAHLLRKRFLGEVISDLVTELQKAYESRSVFQRWMGNARSYLEIARTLTALAEDVRVAKLSQEEVPILRTISTKVKSATKSTTSSSAKSRLSSRVSVRPELKVSAGVEAFDESVSDNQLYHEYADAVLRSFPFHDLLAEVRGLLSGAGFSRLFVFFDDFSELSWVDQKLFVDVILSPLNNASDEMIKLKVAGYPGRIYYGKIDPGKIDTVGLDFYQLYKSQDIQTSEASAVAYLERLLTTRFTGFQEDISVYFDKALPLSEYYRALFEVTMNVPRLIGYILHTCYLDRVSKRSVITVSSIRLAAQKYYETVVSTYFDRMNRFAMEPFERKLDRHTQQQLLRSLVEEARLVRRGILSGQIGGRYFEGIANPPVSHFAVSPEMEKLLFPLELNFLVTKYHEMRDKSGNDVTVFAFFEGLCEMERFPWGYPRGRRDDRSYFVQRCFNYNGVIQQFLSRKQTIRCGECGACYGVEKKANFEMYKWSCPECRDGTCSVVSLDEDFQNEIALLKRETMLPPIELEILGALNDESEPKRAGEIASLIDVTYQLVGHRTSKLSEMGLVEKTPIDGVNRSTITEKARQHYFSRVNEIG